MAEAGFFIGKVKRQARRGEVRDGRDQKDVKDARDGIARGAGLCRGSGKAGSPVAGDGVLSPIFPRGGRGRIV